MGLFLPCNVVISRETDGSHVVSAIDPGKMLSVLGHDGLAPFAEDVKARLGRALQGMKIPA